MQKRQEEAGMGFKLDPREIGWAPYVMIGGGFGVGMLVFALGVLQEHRDCVCERAGTGERGP
jgi:hypothetical protein